LPSLCRLSPTSCRVVVLPVAFVMMCHRAVRCRCRPPFTLLPIVVVMSPIAFVVPPVAVPPIVVVNPAAQCLLRTAHSSPLSSPISTYPKMDDLIPITKNRESHLGLSPGLTK
jgi:hypothetical protein